MLNITNLNAFFETEHILKDISFNADLQSKIGIIGPNGSGKTTLLKSIAGITPTKGEIYLNNQNLQKLKSHERAKNIALLQQTSQILFPFTIYETVMQGRYTHQNQTFISKMSTDDKQIVEYWLNRTGLWKLRNRSIKQLSGGQLQRVFLARVMVQEPNIVLLDEPTNHLDLKAQIELTEFLDEWKNEKPHRIVIGVFHDLNLALTFADQIIGLQNGNLVINNKTNEINKKDLNDIFGIDLIKFMKNSLQYWL